MLIYDNIPNVPNQQFSINIDGHTYDFRLHLFRDLLYCDSYIDGALIQASCIVTNKGWLIPYPNRLSLDYTVNFRFESNTDEYPTYKDFGKTYFLYSYSKAEIESGVAG